MCSKLIHVVELHSFLWPNDIPLYGCTTAYLLICQSTDIWTVSTFAYYHNAARDFYTSFCADIRLHFSWVYTPRIAGSYVTLHLTF